MSVRRYRCHHTVKAGMPAPTPRIAATTTPTLVFRNRIYMFTSRSLRSVYPGAQEIESYCRYSVTFVN